MFCFCALAPRVQSIADVRQIHRRRYLLQPTSLEFFFTDRSTCFINFPQNREDNRKVYRHIVGLKPAHLVYSSFAHATKDLDKITEM